MDTKGFDDIGVLFGLTSTDESWIEVSHINDQNGIISLSSSCDHVGDKVPMARRVKKYYLPVLKVNLFHSYINGHTSEPFLLGRISDPCILERLLANLFAFLFILVHFLLRYKVNLMQEHSDQCWFSWVNMTHDHNVEGFTGLDLLIDLNCRVFVVVVLSVVIFGDWRRFSWVYWWNSRCWINWDLAHVLGYRVCLWFLLCLQF